MSALKTTIQLLLAVRSSSVSARWGMLTFSSLVQWIRSARHTETKHHDMINRLRIIPGVCVCVCVCVCEVRDYKRPCVLEIRAGVLTRCESR